MNDIFNRVQEVQRFEQNCFIEKLNKYIENNCYNFKKPYPIVAGYILGEPINIKINLSLKDLKRNEKTVLCSSCSILFKPYFLYFLIFQIEQIS